jgi:hypothetical protein
MPWGDDLAILAPRRFAATAVATVAPAGVTGGARLLTTLSEQPSMWCELRLRRCYTFHKAFTVRFFQSLSGKNRNASLRMQLQDLQTLSRESCSCTAAYAACRKLIHRVLRKHAVTCR